MTWEIRLPERQVDFIKSKLTVEKSDLFYILNSCGAGEKARWEKVLATKPGGWSGTLGNHVMEERSDSLKLS